MKNLSGDEIKYEYFFSLLENDFLYELFNIPIERDDNLPKSLFLRRRRRCGTTETKIYSYFRIDYPKIFYIEAENRGWEVNSSLLWTASHLMREVIHDWEQGINKDGMVDIEIIKNYQMNMIIYFVIYWKKLKIQSRLSLWRDSMRKNVVRKNDVVRVVKPDFFVRCGYPLSLKEEMNKLVNNDSSKKELLLQIAKIFNIDVKSVDFYKILKTLAYYEIKNKKFGGNERKIYTKTLEEENGKEFVVIGKKIVVTGTYVPARNRSSWEEIEYEPPYLDKAKSHVILELGNSLRDILVTTDLYESLKTNSIYPLQIEEINVEKVFDNEKIEKECLA